MGKNGSDAMKQSLELLAPAGTADIGIAAIDHGADAVYVGAPKFSARAGAGVPAGDIARLIRHAHLYYARVYVALNTILGDEEIPEALDVIREVHELGADGLIIQDPGLLETDLPPIPLIASTQMHNDTPEKIRFLEEVGFRRVILARELSLGDIRAIRLGSRIELECFVHGALCVSYSGQCYMSQAVSGRSGNRGVCAQPCRMPYTLIDADGNTAVSGRHLLSLKDLNLIDTLPALAAAGVTSFKIEGRYKEIDYVKNVTAAYSLALDALVRSNQGYRRASSGRAELSFAPDPAKTFNRGFTTYFVSGREENMASLDTPKSVGEPVGTVTQTGKGFFRTDCADLGHGDGVCFFTKEGVLAGFRVDRTEGAKVFPNTMKDLAVGVRLYRNHNAALSRLLNRASGRRRIRVELGFRHDADLVRLTATDEDGNTVERTGTMPREKSRDPQQAKARIDKQLSSTGNTPFRIEKVHVADPAGFYPVRFLNGLRREVLERLEAMRLERRPRQTAVLVPNGVPYPEKRLDYHANIFNSLARRFYERHGAQVTEPAFEALRETAGREVMRTRYCLLHELGDCPRCGRPGRGFNRPLRLSDGRRTYLLKFDCDACRMSVILPEGKQDRDI